MREENRLWKIAALYKFTTIERPEELREALYEKGKALGITGTLLIAKEGVNGTMAGGEKVMQDWIAYLEERPEIGPLDVKYSEAGEAPFLRFKVRLKKEIVTLGTEGIDPVNRKGTYVGPDEWNSLIDDPDVLLVDTRNDYEVAVGTFEGAVNPQTTSFRELPGWAEANLGTDRDRKIAMFCTGGIRCEKSTALLRSMGYENVFHLEGGILKYLEEVPEEESRWQGECFVFDSRVTVGHGLQPGSYDMCHACRMPISETDKKSKHFEPGISCPHCFDQVDEGRRERFAERQKQIDLAKTRDDQHLAADVEEARARKRQEREAQRQRSTGTKSPNG